MWKRPRASARTLGSEVDGATLCGLGTAPGDAEAVAVAFMEAHTGNIGTGVAAQNLLESAPWKTYGTAAKMSLLPAELR
jgi:hypothetical protein